MGVAGVAQQLDDDVLDAADVVLGLPALGLGDLKADVAVAEGLLDLEKVSPETAVTKSMRSSWESCAQSTSEQAT